jgi:hypothetical protein
MVGAAARCHEIFRLNELASLNHNKFVAHHLITIGYPRLTLAAEGMRQFIELYPGLDANYNAHEKYASI